jgi:4-methyl-5(b-hydroxyethyl)-thiazole monophosphate biosynthesis
MTTVDILRRCNIEVTVAGLVPEPVNGAHKIRIIPDASIEEINLHDFDAVILPGGAPGYQNLRDDDRVIHIVKTAFEQGKIVAAICGAPTALSDAGVIKGKKCTIYPGMEEELEKGGGLPQEDIVVIDGNVVTSKGPATALPFALALAEIMIGKEISQNTRKNILSDLVLAD